MTAEPVPSGVPGCTKQAYGVDVARGRVHRNDGGWAYRVDAGLHPDSGKRRQVSRQGFPTRQAAEEALAEVVAEQSRREQAIRRLDKYLGSVPLQDLTPMEVQRCYAELLASGGRDGGPLAPKTVRHAHVVLRKALGDAARMGVVSRNVATLARPPSSDSPEMNTWSSGEMRRFLSAIEGHPYEIGWRLLAATGKRRGEVLGLRWGDVDLDLGVLAVSNTISEVGADVVMGPPKTARSRRSVYLDRRTLAALLEHRHHQQALRLGAGAAWDVTGDWVVTDESVGPSDRRRCRTSGVC